MSTTITTPDPDDPVTVPGSWLDASTGPQDLTEAVRRLFVAIDGVLAVEDQVVRTAAACDGCGTPPAPGQLVAARFEGGASGWRPAGYGWRVRHDGLAACPACPTTAAVTAGDQR